jgi:tripartite ATP-independent transporter DctP family solute receptor
MTNHSAFRRTLIAGATAAIAALAFSVATTATAQTVLKAADVHPAGYPNVVAMESLGKKLEAATSGKFKLQMFPSGVLGGEKEMIEQTQVGAINILRTSLGPLGPVVPDVNVFNMPFVFRNEAHMRAVIDGPIGQEILDKITASPSKMVALGWMDGGSRSLYTKKMVKTPADLKGQKVRMMGNPLFVDTMNAMGGNGIAMGYGEVFSALQTGVLDGAENNPPSMFTSNHYNAGTKFYAQTNHLIIPEIFVMSRVTWDKLSKDEQALVQKFSKEAQLEQRTLWDKSVAEYTVKLKAAGVEFVAVDQKPFYDATAPVRAKYGAPYADLIKRIEAVK